jgi:hypothetical protein
MKRLLRLLPSILVLATAGAVAQDRGYDPKALARYDVSYQRCEARFPEMKGHGDEAYLNLWRATLNDTTRSRLASVRGSAPYKAERKVAACAAAASPTPEAQKKLEQQCRGLWGEMAKAPKQPK